ncbi:MAG: hypothetical protein K8M05_18920 [Deltaproteobacteria bacterium]|nr:hypothetical protein [Kofleriaceae bacterium]
MTAAAFVAAGLVAGGCKKKQGEAGGSAPVAALGAIPADATVVVGIDVRQLAQAEIVARAVDQMLLRDPELATRLGRLAKDCGVDVTQQVEKVHLALGPRSSKGGAPPSLLVATGKLAEPALTACLQAGTGAGGGQLTVRDMGGRTLYKLTEGARVLHFAFGQADTVVIGADEAWVLAAVGGSAKVDSSPALGPLFEKVDREAAVWAVATMDAELGAALTRITKGKVGAAPQALHGALRTRSGLAGDISFVMASEADADALVGFARGELEILAMAAQAMGIGRLVAKVRVERKGAEAQFRVALTDEEVHQLLSAVDRGQGSGQDAHPADAGPPPDAGPSGDANAGD